MKLSGRFDYRRHSKGPQICLHLVFAGLVFGATPPRPAPAPEQKGGLSDSPLGFEANQGQTKSAVNFLCRGDGYVLFLTSDSAVFKLRASHPSRDNPALAGSSAAVVRMKLAGANPDVRVSGADMLPGTANYFTGNDPKKWTSSVRTFGKVNYRQIYHGIDLVYYGTERQLEYDFVVAPGGDPGQIALEFSGAKPALGPEGDLLLTLDGAPLTFRKPAVYQDIAGKKKTIEGNYRLSGGRVEFALGKYDHSHALTIDPVLSYLTYLGGSKTDLADSTTYSASGNPAQGMSVDQTGNVYVTGRTQSTDFPVQGAIQAVNTENGFTGFVAKLNPTGSQLIYSTYIGGGVLGDATNTQPYAVAVDASGSAYITGFTNAPQFPVTTGAYQTICGNVVNNKTNCPGSGSAFLTKLNPNGGLVYSTFLGPGPGPETAVSVAVDSRGQAYIAGVSTDQCDSNNTASCFPTTANAVLPGSAFNHTTNPNNFNQGSAFISVFDAAGAHLLYSSLFGGNGSPAGNNHPTFASGVAVDSSGAFYLVGTTQSNQLPVTPGAFQTTYYGNPNPGFGTSSRGFVAKFSPVSSGASLVYTTYVGGFDKTVVSYQDVISGIAADAAGNAYISGNASYDFPATPGASDSTPCPAGSCQNRGFLAKLNPTGSALVWATFFGNPTRPDLSAASTVSPPRLDASGNLYVSGVAGNNTQYPLVNPLQPANGFGGVYVTMFDPIGSTIYFSTVIYDPAGNTQIFNSGVDVDSQGNIYVAGYTATAGLPVTTGAFRTNNAGAQDAFIAKISNPLTSARITTGGIVPVYSTVPVIQPGEWVSIYGANLASGTAIWTGNFPTSLGGTSVTIDGKAAYLWYVSPTQINLQVPDNLTPGSVQVVIKTAAGGTATSTVTVAPFAPSFNLLDAKHVAGIVLRSDGSGANGGGSYDIIGPTGSSLGYLTVAAKAGDTVELFGVGFGPTNPPVAAGALFTGVAATANPVTLTINNVSVTPSFAGETSAGLYQLNFTVPLGLGSGDVSLRASVGGAQTPTATISLR